jgi:ATP-dependent DNA ligase
LRYGRRDGHVFLYAFDLIELDGDDLRHEPIERRKAALAKLIRRAKMRIPTKPPGDSGIMSPRIPT